MSEAALERLLGEEGTREREFPICRHQIYFAHAAVGPLPKRVTGAMNRYLQRASEESQDFDALCGQMEEVRAAAARFVGADASEIALLGPTSLGLSLVANGLAWRAGDEVVCYGDDYPAIVYPWLELGRRGVELVYLQSDTPGVITLENVEAALTKRTRLVALASCNFLTGYRPDLEAIGRMLRERGVLFAVDAIQSLGAFPFPAAAVDFMSADSHKWLLGPETAGIVFVKKERQAELRPTLIGGSNVVAPNNIAQREIAFVRGAQRYEPGAMNYAGLFGLEAALDLQTEFGVDIIADRLRKLKRAAVECLQSLGCILLPPAEGPNSSSITTFSHPASDSAEIVRALAAERVIASLRFDRAGNSYVRISPHFYNTLEEIEGMSEVLERALKAC